MVHKMNKKDQIISTVGAFMSALKVSITDPPIAFFFLKTIIRQRKAQLKRLKWIERGIQVPPVIIFSITNKCNLNCKGCYNKALRLSSKSSQEELQEELDTGKVIDILNQARELGVSFIVVAGGEPFVRKDLLEITENFPELIFLVFTNGLLIDDALLEEIRRQKNVILVISIEGRLEQTDYRRGEGVFDYLDAVISKLKKESLFFGVAITMTRQNFESIIDNAFVAELVGKGCKLFFYIEYTPIEDETMNWTLTGEQREKIPEIMKTYRKRFKAIFAGLPAEEKIFGGCLSAGRGFVHINARGDLEPCPFAPFSDVNLREYKLKDALKSKLLEKIRKNREVLEKLESKNNGGCSLWANREWVKSILG